MTPQEQTEILKKKIEKLSMLINAAKMRGDIDEVIFLETELIQANNAINAS